MLKYLKDLFELSPDHARKLKLGLFFLFLQNFSVLLSFIAIYLSFVYRNDLHTKEMLTIIGFLVASFLIYGITNYFYIRNSAGIVFTIMKDYRLSVAERLKNAPMGYFSEQSLSKILHVLNNVLKLIESTSSVFFTFLYSSIFLACILLIGLFGMSVKVGLLALLFLLIILFITRILFKLSYDSVMGIQNINGELYDAFSDGLRGIPVLKSFPQVKDSFIETIHRPIFTLSDRKKALQATVESKTVILNRFIDTAVYLGAIAVVVFACYLYSQGEIPVEETLTLSVAGMMMFLGIKQIENAVILGIIAPNSLNYSKEVFDIPSIQEGGLEVIDAGADIVLDHVGFGYNSKREVLHDLSFTIPGKMTTALVGPSGCGKTTIINLLARFYDPQKGTISIGDHNIKDYTVRTLLRNLSLVFQDVYLFDDTIKNNIRFARPDASDEEVIEAAKRARCHEFITELPDGYETFVGTGGSRLSGGEKQRVSIARALLKNAPIVLLDEATSSVDPENEYEILQAIRELTQGRTVITIAHRLSTVENADQILVIDDGRLIQQGTHEELIKQEGLYKRFIDARKEALDWKIA